MRNSINQEIAIASEKHCRKLTWMLLHNPKEIPEVSVDLTTAEGMKDVKKALSKMFAERNILHLEYKTPYAMMVVDTEEAIENEVREYINGASFAYKDLVCRPEYIRVYDKKTLGLFITHMSLEGESDETGRGKKKAKNMARFNEDIMKLSFQYYILEKLGYKVSSCTIYYVNKKYTKKSSRHTWSEFFSQDDVLDLVKEHQFATKLALDDVRELMKLEKEPACERLMADKCIVANCPLFDACKKELKCENSTIWTLSGLWKTKKCDAVNMGIISDEDIISAYNVGSIKLNANQMRQLRFKMENRQIPHVDKQSLRDWWNKEIKGKDILVFFDFESYMYVLPKFKNLQPYTQLPFQWSAHVLDVATNEIKHYEFLGQKHKDPREACAKKILELPRGSNVAWVAYNMSFEKSVIGKLGETFPEMQADLDVVYKSFVDLYTPFQHHWYYSNAFGGSASIKKVLPGLFPNSKRLDYHYLDDIQCGTDAQRGYLQMQSKKGEDLRKLKENMLKYCALDTWAMVMIYGFFVEFLASNCNEFSIPETVVEDMFTIA